MASLMANIGFASMDRSEEVAAALLAEGYLNALDLQDATDEELVAAVNLKPPELRRLRRWFVTNGAKFNVLDKRHSA